MGDFVPFASGWLDDQEFPRGSLSILEVNSLSPCKEFGYSKPRAVAKHIARGKSRKIMENPVPAGFKPTVVYPEGPLPPSPATTGNCSSRLLFHVAVFAKFCKCCLRRQNTHTKSDEKMKLQRKFLKTRNLQKRLKGGQIETSGIQRKLRELILAEWSYFSANFHRMPVTVSS